MEFEGRTEPEAVQKACTALNLSEDELDYTVVDEGSGGVFGIGARPVQIRVRAPEGSASAPAEPAEAVEPAEPAEPAGPAEPAKKRAAKTDDDSDEGGVVGPAPEKAARALEVAQGLTERMGLDGAKVSVRDDDEQIVVVIEEREEGATDVGEVLGQSRPPAIPSFQFLLNKIVNRFPEDRKHIVVEVPSVPRRERKAEAPPPAPAAKPAPEVDPDLDPVLVELARSLAERSQQLNKVLTVHPMRPGDRRALHQTITAIDGVSTISEGEGLYRRLHVIPDSLKGGGGKKRRRRRRRRRRSDEEGASAEHEPAGDDGDDAELQDASA